MPPRCRRCKEAEALSKPLFQCVRCSRYYHSACHPPHPRDHISNWVCKRCLAGHKGQGKRLGFYHDRSLSSTRAASPSSASPGRHDSRIPRMAPTVAAGSDTNTLTSFRDQRNDSPSAIIKCSYPDCPAKIGKSQVLCEAHLQRAISQNGENGDSIRANGSHSTLAPAPAPPSVSGSPRQFTSTLFNPKKLLPETDKDRPILRRKTDVNPPQFVTQQPTPKGDTPSSSGDPTMSSRSPQPLARRASVRSPPHSPESFKDGERANKRQKLSPSLQHSPKARVNGTAQTQRPTADSASKKNSVEPRSPQFSRRASDHSSQQPGKARDKEGKIGSRSNGRHFMRRLPLNLTNLRFIDGPGDGPPAVPLEPLSSGLKGSAEAAPRRSSGGLEPSVNGGMTDYFAKRISTSTSSATRIGSIDSSAQTRRLSELSDGQSHGSPLDRRMSDLRNGYGSLQADGGPKPPHQKLRFPPRPTPITKTQPPKQKEIDTSHFDSLIYSQPGASTPPPDIDFTTTKPLPPPAKPARAPATEPSARPKDEPLYLDIDPRTHWPQSHSPAWHAAKQAEIQDRGKRKANFGRAAQSLHKQQANQDAVSPEETLPEKILENPAWVRALRRLRGLPTPSSSNHCSSSSASSGSAAASLVDGETGRNGSVNGHGNGVDGVHGLQRKGGRKAAAATAANGGGGGGGGAGGVTGKRVGKSGLVIFTGLNGSHLGTMKRLSGGDMH